jgi:uncharacterized phage infection (PIP) family protein YhgE
MAADRDDEEPTTPDGDEDAPDWTTWLRSRLERVSSSERKAAGSVDESAGEPVGGDEQRGAATPSEPAPARPPLAAPTPAPVPPPGPVQTPAPVPPPGPVQTPAPVPPPGPVQTPAPVPPRPAPTTPGSGSEMEALRAAVTALVAGVAALADTFSGFRSVMTERLDEYSGAVLQVSRDTAAELEEHRKVHVGASEASAGNVAEVSDELRRLAGGMQDLAIIRSELEEHRKVHAGSTDELGRDVAEIGERLRRLAAGMDDLATIRDELEEHRKVHVGASEASAGSVAEVSDQLQRLAAGMEHLADIRSDDERWAEVMGRLLDDVDAERQAGERERSAADSMAERLQGLEHVVQGVVADLAEMAAGNQRLGEEVGEVTASQQRVGEELAEITATQQRIAEVLAEMAAGQQRVAEEVAEVAAVAREPEPDMEPVPLRLDDAQIRMLAEVVREAAADKRPPPPPRGPRQAPLRAERKSASPRPSR